MNQTDEKSKSRTALQEILACRVCLATTGKMFCIETCGLKQAFFDITGTQVSLGDGLPQHVCYICCALLRKAVEFRNKCHSTRSLLSNVPLTLDLMQQINSLHGQQLMKTNVVYVSVGDELIVKLEETGNVSYDKENCFDDKKVMNDGANALCDKENDLCNTENYLKDNVLDIDLSEFLTVKIEDDKLTTENYLTDSEEINDNLNQLFAQKSDVKNKNKNRKVKNKKDSTSKRRPNSNLDYKVKIQDILNSPSLNRHKKSIYKYFEAKYIEKTWNKDNPLSDFIVKTENNITFNFDPKVNQFYDFLRDRYGYIDADRDADRDAARDAVPKIIKEEGLIQGLKKEKEENKPTRYQIYSAKKAIEFGDKYNFKIVTFSRDEQIKNMRERMETDRYKNAKYKCEDCYAGFQYEHKYTKHRTKHDPTLSGSHECELCKLRFQRATCLSYHVSACHKYRYICKDCDKPFQRRGDALEHHKRHRGGAIYKCKYCPAIFRCSSYRYDHMRAKHGSVSCDICHVTMIPGGLAQHMRLQHSETFKCQSCAKVFNDCAALDKHTGTSPNGVCGLNDWPCTNCGENFGSESLLKEHIAASPRNPGCQKETTMLSVSQGNKRKKQTLKGENKDGGSDLCELCGRTFATVGSFRDHLRIHTGDKPFKCEVCSKRFRLKVVLEGHARTHTGEKPFKCPDCMKTFSLYSNLRRHQTSVHQNMRPYTCDICNKSFVSKSNVQLHIRTVHMKIPMPPRVRNRKMAERGERTVQAKVKRHIVERLEGYEDERRDSEEEETTADTGEKEGRTEDLEEDKTEFLEEWMDDAVIVKPCDEVD